MNSLSEIIDTEASRSRVISNCVSALDKEIEKKSGATGLVVKKAYSVARKTDEGQLIPNAVDKLLDRFIDVLDPYYQEYNDQDESTRPSFSDFLQSREDDVTESLLSVTDHRANNTEKMLLVKAYNALRPMAANQVKQGIPVVGSIIEKHAFKSAV